MSTTYKNGIISFNFSDMLDSLDFESKQEIIERLACESDIVKHVIGQVLDGHTENWSYGPKNIISESNPQFGIDWAMRQIAVRSGEVAAKEIERLERAIEHEKEDHEGTRKILQEYQSRNQY